VYQGFRGSVCYQTDFVACCLMNRFILGFFIASIPWYVGAFIFLCLSYDPRERSGFASCAIAVYYPYSFMLKCIFPYLTLSASSGNQGFSRSISNFSKTIWCHWYPSCRCTIFLLTALLVDAGTCGSSARRYTNGSPGNSLISQWYLLSALLVQSICIHIAIYLLSAPVQPVICEKCLCLIYELMFLKFQNQQLELDALLNV
jgi:hypothetical protein